MTVIDAQEPLGTLKQEENPVELTMPIQPLHERLRNLDAQIASIEQHLQRLKYLRWALEDPMILQRSDLASQYTLEQMASLPAPPGFAAFQEQSAPPSAAQGVTHFGKISMYFNARNNEWATSKQVAHDTNLKESVIREVLYKTHKDNFERQQNPGSRGKLFRLKQGGKANEKSA